MLKEFVEQKHCNFYDEAADWQDAIRKCCEPLLADGTVTEQYPEDIIASVKKYGPYFILVPGLAMPHAQEGGGKVFKTTISFMKLQKPVRFDQEDPDSYADLFFTLAACNHNEHLEHMAALMEIFENEELMDELHKVKSEKDVLQLADKYGL
ncbi:MAG: PTS sugar transporter subunit IIA [Eubacterium sp.]